MTALREVASHFRSKNAGPFMCTIDIFFDDLPTLQRVAQGDAITPETVAQLYRISAESVRVYTVDSALAMKVSFPRRVPAGDPADRDIPGGQQYAPLLDIEV
jgi:hypothetical protein